MARRIGRLVICALALAVPLGLAGQAHAAVVSCGQTLSTNTDVGNNLANCPADGLDVGADGITIRLLGHTITAAPGNSASGINFNGHDHVRVIGGPGNSITGFGSDAADAGLLIDGDDNIVQQVYTRNGFNGILITGGSRNAIDASTQRGGQVGIALTTVPQEATQNKITHDSAIDNGGAGIQLVGDLSTATPTANQVSDSTISGSPDGIKMTGSKGDTVASNSLVSNTAGIDVVSSRADTLIKANTATGGTWGYLLQGCLFTVPPCAAATLRSNKARGAQTGFELDEGATGTLYDNRAEQGDTGFFLFRSGNSSGGGVLLDSNQAGSASCSSGGAGGNTSFGIRVGTGSQNTTIIGNRACNNGTPAGFATGVRIDGADDTTLTNNVANFNSGDGLQLFVASGEATLTGNSAHRNGNFGIESFGGTDGGHNSAVGNAVGQCTGVACS